MTAGSDELGDDGDSNGLSVDVVFDDLCGEPRSFFLHIHMCQKLPQNALQHNLEKVSLSRTARDGDTKRREIIKIA